MMQKSLNQLVTGEPTEWEIVQEMSNLLATFRVPVFAVVGEEYVEINYRWINKEAEEKYKQLERLLICTKATS